MIKEVIEISGLFRYDVIQNKKITTKLLEKALVLVRSEHNLFHISTLALPFANEYKFVSLTVADVEDTSSYIDFIWTNISAADFLKKLEQEFDENG